MTNLSKILLVDDQAFIRQVYRTDLEKLDFVVFCAAGGQEALQILAEQTVDLVLLDAMMPRMDGFQTCMRIRSHPSTKKIPVIFLTANANKETVIQAVQAGATDFCVKGPKTTNLVSKINKILRRG